MPDTCIQIIISGRPLNTNPREITTTPFSSSAHAQLLLPSTLCLVAYPGPIDVNRYPTHRTVLGLPVCVYGTPPPLSPLLSRSYRSLYLYGSLGGACVRPYLIVFNLSVPFCIQVTVCC